jgi:mRNA-degrading endonuclease HigB of HigAB toxin-antitoxin module
VVFHIKGNAYQLVVAIADRLQIVPVKSSADRIV